MLIRFAKKRKGNLSTLVSLIETPNKCGYAPNQDHDFDACPKLTQLACNAVANNLAMGVSMGLGCEILPSELAYALFKRLKEKKQLNVRTVHALTKPNLKILDLTNLPPNIKFDTNELERSVRQCRYLECLRTHDIVISSQTLGVLCQPQYFNNLRCLSLSSCTLDETMLRTLILSAVNLSELNLSGSNVSDACFQPALDPSYAHALSMLGDSAPRTKKRKRLSEEDTLCDTMDVDSPPCPQNKKKHVYVKKPNMAILNVSGCTGISNKGIEGIALMFPMLASFDCSHCDQVTSIEQIVVSCKLIRHLAIDGCPVSSGDPAIWQSNPDSLRQLKSFTYSGTGVLDAGWTGWFEQCAESLTKLQLRNKDPEDEDLPSIWLQKCTRLKYLDIYGLSVTSNFIGMLVENTRCHETLKTLDLTHCCGITVSSIRKLGQTGLPALKSLTLSLPRQFGTADLQLLGKGCPELEHLCINYAPRGVLRTGDGLEPILSTYPKLKHIELWCCDSVTQEMVASIPEICKNVTSILVCRVNARLRDRPCLSEREFTGLKQKHPNIEFKIWHHTVLGNRHFQYHAGARDFDCFDERNKLTVQLTPDKHLENCYKARVLVDNIPIWSNEKDVCINHLIATTVENSGAIPLVGDWCCECNVETYNGVLFYHHRDCIIWETHEPGSKRRFCFQKDNYNRVVKSAVTSLRVASGKSSASFQHSHTAVSLPVPHVH